MYRCLECGWVGEPIDNSIPEQEHIHLQCRNCGSVRVELPGPRRSAIMSKEMMDDNCEKVQM